MRGKNLAGMELVASAALFQGTSFAVYRPHNRAQPMPPSRTTADRRILRLMQQDATLSTQGLADAAGLADLAARARLQALRRYGVRPG